MQKRRVLLEKMMGTSSRVASLIAGLTFMSGLAVPVGADDFVLTSPAFTNGAKMPKYTEFIGMGCDGLNRSPELNWSGAPAGTRSFSLTIHDADAGAPGGWWHWVRYSIPWNIAHLGPGSQGPGTDATTSFKTARYGGPCPPPGDKPHHYRFVLRALDVRRIGATPQTTGPQLDALEKGHVLGEAVLVGRFGRPK
jgi:Raf kinase inhibitor-like YbhB/YbcL family protein